MFQNTLNLDYDRALAELQLDPDLRVLPPRVMAAGLLLLASAATLKAQPGAFVLSGHSGARPLTTAELARRAGITPLMASRAVEGLLSIGMMAWEEAPDEEGVRFLVVPALRRKAASWTAAQEMRTDAAGAAAAAARERAEAEKAGARAAKSREASQGRKRGNPAFVKGQANPHHPSRKGHNSAAGIVGESIIRDAGNNGFGAGNKGELSKLPVNNASPIQQQQFVVVGESKDRVSEGVVAGEEGIIRREDSIIPASPAVPNNAEAAEVRGLLLGAGLTEGQADHCLRLRSPERLREFVALARKRQANGDAGKFSLSCELYSMCKGTFTVPGKVAKPAPVQAPLPPRQAEGETPLGYDAPAVVAGFAAMRAERERLKRAADEGCEQGA